MRPLRNTYIRNSYCPSSPSGPGHSDWQNLSCLPTCLPVLLIYHLLSHVCQRSWPNLKIWNCRSLVMKPILMETAQGAVIKTAELTHQSLLNCLVPKRKRFWQSQHFTQVANEKLIESSSEEMKYRKWTEIYKEREQSSMYTANYKQEMFWVYSGTTIKRCHCFTAL